MDQWRKPSGEPLFSPVEERLIEFIRAGTLDAEIAVRLGIPVGDVKDRIERLRHKLNLPDRAALATYRPGSPISPPPSAALPTDPEQAVSPQPQTPGRSRLTTIALGALALFAVGAGVAAVALSSGGGAPAAPPATDTPAVDTPDGGIQAGIETAAHTPTPFAGIEPLPLTFIESPTEGIGVGPFWLLFLRGCWGCDGIAESLARVSGFARPDGAEVRIETLFISEEGHITSVAATVDGHGIYLTVCIQGSCQAEGISEDARTAVYHSTDGGVSWARVREYEGVQVVRLATAVGPVLETLSPQGFPSAFFWGLETEPVPYSGPPIQWLGLSTDGLSVTSGGGPLPGVRSNSEYPVQWPGLGVARTVFAFQQYAGPPFNFVLTWYDHELDRAFVGEFERHTGLARTVIPADNLDVAAAPGAPRNLLLGNYRHPDGRSLPALIDLENRAARVLPGPWDAPPFNAERNWVITGRLGTFARVTNLDGPDDCLHIREGPSTEDPILTCLPEGVLLSLARSDTPGWTAVVTFDGTWGFASDDYLQLTW